MTARWAVSIPVEQIAASAPLRLHADVEACVDDDRLWLRGTRWNESLDRSLRMILGAERFHQLDDGQTTAWGCTVASGNLPAGPWTTFSDWLEPVSPATVLPAKIGPRAALRLVRTSAERMANLLIVGFDTWRDFALHAPQLRLNRLSFAVSDDALVLIRGEPLPPLPGTMFSEEHGIAVPIGWAWSPAIDATVLRHTFSLADGDLALFTIAGKCDIICGDDFVRATRSAVRLTEKELGREA